MKTSHYVIAAVLLVTASSIGYWIGSRGTHEDMTASQTEDSGEGEILYWRAPMDPTETYDGPGQSKMGMDLIPVYADDQGPSSTSTARPAGTVQISDAVSQQMGVRYGLVHRMDLNRSIRTVGEVMVNDENVFVVNARISGWIQKLHVSYDGAAVSKGDPLLEIYSPEFVSTQEEYIRAMDYLDGLPKDASAATREGAERLVEASRIRLINWEIPEDVIMHLGHTRKAEQTVTLRSPVSGVVLQKDVTEGGFVNKGSNLFRIADLSSVWVHASFYDYELPWISQGQSVEVELSYLPGKVYSGVISYIYPVLREQARDVHVRIVVRNPQREIKPGMFANVQVEGTTLKNVLVVPTEAILRSGARSLVFVAAEDGAFEPREVETGGEGGPGNGLAYIIRGVEEGERVVTSAQFLIDSESRLQEAIQKMRASRNSSSDLVPGDVSQMDHSGDGATNGAPAGRTDPAKIKDPAKPVEHDMSTMKTDSTKADSSKTGTSAHDH
ncbi:efflux RND transporter periplasmic adaptor subunit [bacterium]|nr:efflux RND transporter periplasmic adaptor subunit [bacterium]